MQHVHFIGIGGAGMSGLAEILLARGVAVSGSDLVRSEKTDELKKQGAKIFIEHDAKHITDDIDTVVYSSAVRNSGNPELAKAEELGIRTIRRADFLGELTRDIPTVAVAGTHGKTTTSSMIAHILIESGLDPLVSVGAKVQELGGKNSRAGKGNVAVVEADEYDRSFLALHPYIAVITTLEAEHLDVYKDLADLEETFISFANARDNSKEQGYAVVNIDEPSIRNILSKLEKKIITFGVSSEEAKYKAKDISVHGLETRATIVRGGETLGELLLSVPGEHNIKNALAAIAVSDALAIPFDRAKTSLASFRGAERRAEVIGEAGGILIIDDYAHHPTEIRATLSALRKGYPGRRIIASFQPHTFTRTRDFAEEFGKVFGDLSDELLLLDVYPAREKPIAGVTSDLILRSYNRRAEIVPLEELPAKAAGIARSGDIILTIGAGTITEAAPKILAKLKENQKKK
jgi:UDP-N-acetylmuramate--alanine ligase